MKKLLSVILIAALLAETAPAALIGSGLVKSAGMSAFAEIRSVEVRTSGSVSEDSRFAGVKTGKYQYASNEAFDGSVLAEDTYRYSDRWFTGSSYELNWQLADLSACAAVASTGYYKDKEERDNASNSTNIRALLHDIGFNDVETNKYYDREKEQHSVGCIVGNKVLNVAGKEYTLLAVMPRSAGYKQEWVGNFTVGKGPMHEGFKAARDEILRFVKNYISGHEIKGDVKVWIAGHSRGGACSNMLGGFFAEGGAGYFDGVTIASEDVYCYSLATPTTILQADGVKRKTALSVAGSRGGRYADDSNAEFTYTGSDAEELIKPHEGVYRCIHNCSPQYDIITLLPPQVWGYDRYGVEFPITDGSPATKKRMKEALKEINAYAYDAYVNGGDEENFTWKTFDFAKLGFVDDTDYTEKITQADFMRQRIDNGLAAKAKTVDDYVDEGYQEALRSLAAAYGMGLYAFLKGASKDTSLMIKAAVFSYISYACERLVEEKGYTEKRAAAVAVEELIEYLTGDKIDPENYTVDDLLVTFTEYMADSADYKIIKVKKDEDDDFALLDTTVEDLEFKSATAEMTFNAMANGIITSLPESARPYISYIIKGYDPENPDSPESVAAVRTFLFSFIRECAYGSGDSEWPDHETAKSRRELLYGLAAMLLSDEKYEGVLEAIADSGSGPAEDLVDAIIKMMLVETDEEGGEIRYSDVAEASEAYLGMLAENGFQEIIDSGRYDEGSVYQEDLINHKNVIKHHLKQLRRIVLDLVFYEVDSDGKVVPFNTRNLIRTASTFIAQANKVPPAHYNEIYIAWMRAQNTVGVAQKEATEMLRVLCEENKDNVLSEDKLSIVGLKAADKIRDAKDADEVEAIFAGAVGKVEAMIEEKEEEDKKTKPLTAVVINRKFFTYNGKEQKPEVSFVVAGDTIVGVDNYDVQYSGGNSVDAGRYTITVTGKGKYSGSRTAEYIIRKTTNPVKIKVKAKKVSVKYSKKKARKVKRAKMISVAGAKTEISYKLDSVKKAAYRKYFKINKKTGKLTVKKGLKKGTYTVKIKVKAAEDKNYKAKTKTLSVKVRVK